MANESSSSAGVALIEIMKRQSKLIESLRIVAIVACLLLALNLIASVKLITSRGSRDSMSYADAHRVVDMESVQVNILSSNIRDGEEALSKLESLESQAKAAGRPIDNQSKKDEIVRKINKEKGQLAIWKKRLDTDVAIRNSYLPDDQRIPPELQD